jgi:mannose-6-phosphate isomerase-like protein (cupin superfamily)
MPELVPHSKSCKGQQFEYFSGKFSISAAKQTHRTKSLVIGMGASLIEVEVYLDPSMKNNYPRQISKVGKNRALGSSALKYGSGVLTTGITPQAPVSHSSVSYPAPTPRFEPSEHIIDRDQLLAIIISRNFDKPGTHFFTPNDLSQQLGYMRHPAGKVIEPHIHKPVVREVQYTQEVLLIKQGKLRVDFYNNQQQYINSRILVAGDVILLATGGHGFEVLEEVEMIEIKQGPYIGEDDRTRFEGISADRAQIKG